MRAKENQPCGHGRECSDAPAAVDGLRRTDADNPDEGHHCAQGNSWTKSSALSARQKAGVTATPYVSMGASRSFLRPSHRRASTQELIDMGYLAPLAYSRRDVIRLIA